MAYPATLAPDRGMNILKIGVRKCTQVYAGVRKFAQLCLRVVLLASPPPSRR